MPFAKPGFRNLRLPVNWRLINLPSHWNCNAIAASAAIVPNKINNVVRQNKMPPASVMTPGNKSKSCCANNGRRNKSPATSKNTTLPAFHTSVSISTFTPTKPRAAAYTAICAAAKNAANATPHKTAVDKFPIVKVLMSAHLWMTKRVA